MAGGNVPSNLAPLFVAAGRQYGIPANVLAGVASVETNLGANRSTSSAGAVGLMQFEPSTARSIGINPLDDRQAIFGAAKLLVQMGYHQNPLRALGAYNGGPGNPQYGYARQVMSEAGRLASQLNGVAPGGGVPGMGGSTSTTTKLPPATFQQSTFDQQGYNAADHAYRLGQALKLTQESDPYQTSADKQLGGLGASPLSLLYKTGAISNTPPNKASFQGSKTVNQPLSVTTTQQAQQGLQGLAAAGHSGYVNPIPGARVGRTDMGIDANLAPGAPIRAIGNSRVLGIAGNWYKGQPYLALQLLDGPAKGRVYYVAEQIAPQVRPGQTVRAGDVIARYASSGTGIEMGWANPSNWQQTLAQATTGYSEGQQTAAGKAFRSFLGF